MQALQHEYELKKIGHFGMQELYFITAHGVCGHTEVWDAEDFKYDAEGWLEAFGDRIGSGTAPLPTSGFIDLSQFSTVTTSR